MRPNEVILNELKRRAAALLASGTASQKDVAKILNVKAATVGYWVRQDDFQAMVVELARDQSENVIEGLKGAATDAVNRLRAHIVASDKQGKPLWNVQMEAIKLALAYDLGQPTAKTETKELRLSGDLNKSVLQALSDPTIRQKLLPVPLPLEKSFDTNVEPGSPEGAGQPVQVSTLVREQTSGVLSGDTWDEPLGEAVGSFGSRQGP